MRGFDSAHFKLLGFYCPFRWVHFKFTFFCSLSLALSEGEGFMELI
jgi:hypothetical protein